MCGGSFYDDHLFCKKPLPGTMDIEEVIPRVLGIQDQPVEVTVSCQEAMEEDMPVVLGIQDQHVEATVSSEEAVKKIPGSRNCARKSCTPFNLKRKKCSVGVFLQEPCNKNKYSKRTGIIKCTDLLEEEQFLLHNRTGIEVKRDTTICYDHKREFVDERFKLKQTFCCDPLGRHPNNRPRKNLLVISIRRYQQVLNYLGLPLTIGKKLCSSCASALSANKLKGTLEGTLEPDDSTQEKKEECSVGLSLQEPCHGKKYCKKTGIVSCTDLLQEDQFLLHNRTGVEVTADTTICFHHKNEILGKSFEDKHRSCCDPLGRHPGKCVNKLLRAITIQRQQEVLNKFGLTLTCGKKLCYQCRVALLPKQPENTPQETMDLDQVVQSGSEIQDQTVLATISNEKKEQCSVGLTLQEPCRKGRYNFTDLIKCTDLSEEDQYLLHNRTGIEITTDSTICYYHKKNNFGKRFEHRFKNCYDPLGLHPTKNFSKNLRVISIQKQQEVLNERGLTLTCGRKLCPRCRQAIFSKKTEENNPQEANRSEKVLVHSEPTFKESLNQYGLALQSLRPEYTKCKLKDNLDHVQEPVKRGLRCPQHFTVDQTQFIKVPLDELQDKMGRSTRNEICRVLTLLPWHVNTVQEVFGVSHHLAEKARNLKFKMGIYPNISCQTGSHDIASATEKLVVEFYQNNDISRTCLSLNGLASRRISDCHNKEEKRLLLFSLNETYAMFKEEYPEEKISFSRFCLLRPKSCLIASSPGVQNVCIDHENVKLMILGLPDYREITYRTLLSLMMCKSKISVCHNRKCNECPGQEPLKTFLTKHFNKNDFDEEDKITFMMWLYLDDKLDFTCTSLHVENFINLLVERCSDLISHNYVAKSQFLYFKKLRADLRQNECLIVVEFAENYSFLAQENVRGFERTNKQCTLYPMCIYYRSADNEIKCHSLCVISDCCKRDALTVYAFVHEVMPTVKCLLPFLKEIFYFSNSAEGSHKSDINLASLCNHEKDFGIKAQWHFFPSSHGKGPCDGVAGTLKRLATRACLQDNCPILTSNDLYDWCSQHLKSIEVFHVTTERVTELSKKLSHCIDAALTFGDVRTFNAFVPVSTDTLQCATTSDSKEWHLKCLTNYADHISR